MATELTDEQQQLEFRAFKALTGAEYARARLLHGLSMGTPSIEDDTYLIKSRVKRVDSLILKVMDRRLNNASYQPSHVRDIVGLRLLSLFKSDLPILVRRFLAFVAWSQRPPFSLFYGSDLRDTVEEIKIYATSDVNDVSTDFIVDEFEAYGFSSDRVDRISQIEILRKVSQYSSIHVVLWANGPNHSAQDRIPVEVQLRTSLEDAWGEIDHRIRYKTRSSIDTSHPNIREGGDDLAARELAILKKNLDTCSDLADLVGTKLKTSSVATDAISPYTKFISYDIEKTIEDQSDSKLRGRLRQVIDKLFDLYRSIYEQKVGTTVESLKSIDSRFEDIIPVLTKETDSLAQTAASRSDQSEGLYRLRMELALCWYWRAVVSQTLAAMEGKAHFDTNKQAYTKQSLRYYRDVMRDHDLSSDSVLLFRIANVLSLQGEHAYALSKYESAYSSLRNDPRVPEGHHFRVRIPRHYALALWDSAERNRVKAFELGGDTFFERDRRDQYLRALDITLELDGLDIVSGDLDRRSTSIEEEQRTNVNNVIEYSLCYLKAGGDRSTLVARGLTSTRMSELLTELAGTSVAGISRVTLADTVREAARWLGDRELAVAAAKRVIELLEVKDFSVILPDFSYLEMETDARREIESGLEPILGFPQEWD